MNEITLPWLAEIGIMSWRTVSRDKRPPLPSEILASFVVFGAFSLIPNPRLQAVLGWGIVIASFMNVAGTGELMLHPFGGSANPATANAPYATGATSANPPNFGFQGLPTQTTPGGTKAQ